MSATLTLHTRVEELPGVRAAVAQGLRRLGLTNLGRLVAHVPFRHELIHAGTPLGELIDGATASVVGEVTATRVAGRGPKARFEAVLMDDTGRLDVVWFNQAYRRNQIRVGDRLRVQGVAKRHGPGLQMANPLTETVREAEVITGDRGERLRPVYHASEDVSSAQIEHVIAGVLEQALTLIEDHLRPEYRRSRDLPTLADAYRMIHAPEDEAEAASARRRLAYDELLMMQLALFLRRDELRSGQPSPALRFDGTIDRRIRERLPFTLTPAQDEVVAEVTADLTRTVPTARLIQGDVGSGKTAVAVYAMLMAVASEHQAALMAPTTILAEQHFQTISEMLRGSDVRLALLIGSTPEGERTEILRDLSAGRVNILIGTHALLTERVSFADLAVAVIDEQHRFGVHQRAALGLKSAGNKPHTLVMTATPIPRSLGLTVFGDLDISTIRGLPPGRRPVRTRVVNPARRDDVYRFVRRRVDRGDQVYVVVPTIEGTGENVTGVRALARELESGPLAGVRLASLHGQLARATRETVMERFRLGQVRALVATTVIEVGVDVPDASVMVVEHAERFGLAQLHQLRGRVGRGARSSACILIGEAQTADARERLAIMARSGDGFVIAEKDFELRGPGEVFGSRQAGAMPLKVADLRRDMELLALARRDARRLVGEHPGLDGDKLALLRRRVRKAVGESMAIGDVG